LLCANLYILLLCNL